MRVAMVTTHPIQYQVPWLQRLARREGIDLTVYFAMIPDAAEQGREFGVEFSWDVPLLDGYRYELLENLASKPSLTDFFGCDTPRIHREIRNGRFDAVIVNGWGSKTCLQALVACRVSGTPCIVRGEANGLRPRSAWKRWLHRLLLAQYAAHLPIGTNNRRYYSKLGVPDAKMFDTPYCVDNEHFATSANKWRTERGSSWLCERFGLDPGLPTFLFAGKFVEKKRPADIVEAVRRLHSEGERGLQVLMVGEGPLGESLRVASTDLPIKFAGFLNQFEITSAYAASDCLVLPSDSGETWGLVVNEAMACGLPALVSDQVGCAIDLVSDGLTGDIFPCGDVQAISSTLRRFAADRGLLSEMGKRARDRVTLHYNFEHVVTAVLASLDSINRRNS